MKQGNEEGRERERERERENNRMEANKAILLVDGNIH